MKKLLAAALFATALTAPSLVLAAERTVKLSVPGMSCASCPYMVKSAISKVDGIKSVEATMEDRSATVVFDDTLTNLQEIQEATAGIGYPSTVFDEASGS